MYAQYRRSQSFFGLPLKFARHARQSWVAESLLNGSKASEIHLTTSWTGLRRIFVKMLFYVAKVFRIWIQNGWNRRKGGIHRSTVVSTWEEHRTDQQNPLSGTGKQTQSQHVHLAQIESASVDEQQYRRFWVEWSSASESWYSASTGSLTFSKQILPWRLLGTEQTLWKCCGRRNFEQR